LVGLVLAVAGFAPGAEHLAKAPFAARQRWPDGAGALGQAMNLPAALRHGVA
jgi:hypothetical protein